MNHAAAGLEPSIHQDAPRAFVLAVFDRARPFSAGDPQIRQRWTDDEPAHRALIPATGTERARGRPCLRTARRIATR